MTRKTTELVTVRRTPGRRGGTLVGVGGLVGLLVAAPLGLGVAGCGKDDKGKKDKLCQGAAAKKCVSRGVGLQTDGDPEKAKTALGLYEMTCKGTGEWAMKGCTLAGHLYRTGKGSVKKDEAKALQRYEKACRVDDKGAFLSAPACFRAGNAYGLGKLGAKKDADKAKRYLEAACKKGEKLGCKFAKMLGASTGDNALPKVTARCEGGDAKACGEVGYRYYKGVRGAKKDDAKTVKYMTKACDGKHAGSCAMLGLIHQRGKVGVKKDEAEAAKWYRKACDLDYGHGCVSLAKRDLLESKSKKKRAAAAKTLRTWCGKKQKRACMWLGVAHSRGYGVKKSRAKAKTAFKKACALGDKQGCRFAKK